MPPEKKTEVAVKDAKGPGTDAVNLQQANAQATRIEKAIIVSGIISGLLASGRIPNSRENRAYAETALAFALELMER